MKSRAVAYGKIDVHRTEGADAGRVWLRFERECESLDRVGVVGHIETAKILSASSRRERRQASDY